MSLELLEARHVEYLVNCGDPAMLDALLALKKLARVWKHRNDSSVMRSDNDFYHRYGDMFKNLSQGNHD